MPFDLEGARKAGYSDSEIADFLGEQSSFDTKAARTAGYSDAEILQELSAGEPAANEAPVAQAAPAPAPFADSSLIPEDAVPPARISAPSPHTVGELSFDQGTSPLSSALDQLAPVAGDPRGPRPLGPPISEPGSRTRVPEIIVEGQHGGAQSMGDAPGGPATWGDVGAGILPTIGSNIEMQLVGGQEMLRQSDAKKQFWQAMVIPQAVEEWQAMNAGKPDDERINLADMPAIQEAAKRAGVRPDLFTYGWQDLVKMSPDELAAYKEQGRARIAPEEGRLDELAARRQMAGQVAAGARPNFGNEFGLKALAFDAAVNAPTTISALGIGAAAGPIAGLVGLGATVAPQQYAEMRNEGYSHETALFGTALNTIAEIAPETKVIDFIRSTSVAKGAVKKLIGAGFEEGVSEQITEAMQIGVDMGLLNKDMTFSEAVSRIMRAGILGAVTGAPFGALPSAPNLPEGALDIPEEFLDVNATQMPDPLAEVQRSYGEALSPRTLPGEALGAAPEATPTAAPQTMADVLTAVGQAAGAVPPPPGVSEPPPELKPEPDTIAAPPVSGSPPPDPNSPKASAPIGETGQGVATPAAEPLTTPPAGTAEPTAPPAAPAPTVSTPAPPQAASVSTTAQEPAAGGAVPEKIQQLQKVVESARAEHAALVPQFNALVDQHKAARAAGDEVAAKRVEAQIRPLQQKMGQILGRETRASVLMQSINSAETHRQQMEQLPVGSKQRPSEFPVEKGLYWEKTAPNKWERRGQFGRKEHDIQTDADMQGTVAMPTAVAPPAAGGDVIVDKDGGKWNETKKRWDELPPPPESSMPGAKPAAAAPAQTKGKKAAKPGTATPARVEKLSKGIEAATDPAKRKRLEAAYEKEVGTPYVAPGTTTAAPPAAEAPAQVTPPVETTKPEPAAEPTAEPEADEEVTGIDEDIGAKAAAEPAKQAKAPKPAKAAKPAKVEKPAAPAQTTATTGKQTETPAFKEWFGNSVVVDANGNPLVVYHGTAKDFSEFKVLPVWVTPSTALANQFVAGGRRNMGEKPKKGSSVMPLFASIQKPVDLRELDLGKQYPVAEILKRAGIEPTDAVLEQMARENLGSKHTFVSPHMGDPVAYLVEEYKSGKRLADQLGDPALLALLEANGIDGIRLKESYSSGTRNAPRSSEAETFAVLRKEQLKSAIGNEGTFSKENPSVLKDTGEVELTDEEADAISEKLEGKTGVAPEGEEAQDSSTDPDDPLRRIAAKREAVIRAQQLKNKTPPVAPKRDQELGRSNFDAMWRDLFASGDPNFIGPSSTPATPESAARREMLARRIQNAPLPRQMRVAQRRMQHYFQFKDVVIDPKLSPREALDAMLDAYNNLHTMANVTGQPRQAMGFNGELSLILRHSLGNKGTRGMFSWNFAKGFDASTLSLARRADSFTHEWIHALDLNLLMRFTKSHQMGVSGLADYTRNPLTALPPPIRDAFTDLLSSMFLVDKAAAQEMARLMMVSAAQADVLAKAEAKLKRTEEILAKETEREAKAVAHEQKAAKTKDPFVAAGLTKAAATLRQRNARANAEVKAHRAEVAKAQQALDQTKADTERLLKTKATAFHRASSYVDQLVGKKYFSLPAEMLARAGESWMANRIGQQVGVEFLTGSPDFYNNNADRLMALVYPNAAEREAIFQQYDNLMATLADQQYFTGDTVSARVPGDTAFSKELYVKALEDPKINVFRRGYEAAKKDFVNAAMGFRNLFRKNTVATTLAAMSGAGKGLSAGGQMSFFSITGRAQTLLDSYKGNAKLQALLRKFFSKLVTNPGERSESQGFTAQEDIDRIMKQKLQQLDRIAETYNLDVGNEEQMKRLYEEYVRPTEQIREQLKQHLDFQRARLKEISGDRNKQTEAGSIQRYIKRIEKTLALTPMPENPTTDIQKAALAMRKLSDQLYYLNRDAGIDLGYVGNYMLRVLNRDAIKADRPGFLAQATLAYQMNNTLRQQQLEREAVRLENLAKAADAAEKRGVKPPKEAVAARKKLTGLKEEIDELASANPAEQAEAYLAAIEIPDLYVPDANTPKTKYTKSRKLGPAADLLLADYYDQNPITAMQASIATTAYRVPYAKRFGNDNQEFAADRLAMVKEGLDPSDLELIDDAVKVAFGQTGNFNSAADAVANWALTLAQMKMLAKAAFTNIPEPFNTAATTGRTLDGFKALAYAYLPILRGADKREHVLVMELLGLISSSVNETMIANRSGMEFGSQPLLQKLRAGFGKVSMMHPLTNAGNFGATRVLMDYMSFNAKSWESGTLAQKTEAMEVMNEFGVPSHQRDRFAAYVRGLPKGRPTAMQLLETGNEEMKQIYAGVIGRMLRYSIQQTHRVERARGSFGRVGRFVFSITNFNMGYQRNVLIRQYKLAGGRRGLGGKIAVAAQFTWKAAMLTGLAMLAKMARDFWDDPDRDDKKKEPKDFQAVLDITEAADRAGLTGMLTIPLNWALKFKYERELSALAAGAVPSFYFDSFSKMAKGWAPGRDRNSENTKLDERKAWGAFYDLTFGMASSPLAIMSKVTGPLGWLAVSKINSRGWKGAFAEWAAPKTPTELESQAKADEKAEMSPAEREEAEEERELKREDKNESLELEYGP